MGAALGGAPLASAAFDARPEYYVLSKEYMRHMRQALNNRLVLDNDMRWQACCTHECYETEIGAEARVAGP